MDVEGQAENMKDSSRKESLIQLKDEKKEATENRSKEQRVICSLLSLILVSVFMCMRVLVSACISFFTHCCSNCLYHRENILSGRWRNESYAPTPWVKTDTITGIGGSDVMGGYLLRALTPSCGATIVARKRY